MASQDEGQRARRPKPEASVTAHAVTGALEGAAGIYATEPFLDKYLHGRKVNNPFKGSPLSHAKKITIGAAVGALATAPFGALVEKLRKRKMQKPEQRLAHMASQIPEVTEFRKIYNITEDPEDEEAQSIIKIPGDSKAHAALKGGIIGGLAGAGLGAGLGLSALPLAKRIGKKTAQRVGKLEKLLGGRAGARAKTSLAAVGIVGKIGATVGAIQGVASHTDDLERSKAISRALRKARAEVRGTEMDRVISALVELEEYIPRSRLKSGYRLDKYEKTISSHEIDRKTGNYARAITAGALGGILIPARGTLKQRALAGAGAGAALTTGLHIGAKKDEYGEQSEGAKIAQRRIIQGAGAAAFLAGIIGRKAQITKKIKSVFGK
jgi:hypothetical protein